MPHPANSEKGPTQFFELSVLLSWALLASLYALLLCHHTKPLFKPFRVPDQVSGALKACWHRIETHVGGW